MLILTAYNEQFECDEVIKDGDKLRAYKNGTLFVSFEGISDFGGYALADKDGNSVEFSTTAPPQPTPEQQRLDDIEEFIANFVYGGGAV